MGRMPHTNHFGGLKSKDIEIVNYYIKLLNLKELKNQQINNLSDGQFQKVMIAKALAQETPLLLLDEPTAFLDIKNKEIIFKLLKKLAVEMGKTIFVSTHNLDFCKEYCDDLWLIKDNKLKVYPGNEITKEFFN